MSGEWVPVMKKLLVAFVVVNVIQMAGTFGWFSSPLPATIVPAADASGASDAGAVLALATFSGSAHVPLFAVAKDSADHGGGNDKGGGNSGGGNAGGSSGGSSHSGGNSGGSSGGGSSGGSAGGSSGGSSHSGGSSGGNSGGGNAGGSSGDSKSSGDNTRGGSATSNDKSVSTNKAGSSDTTVSGSESRGDSGKQTPGKTQSAAPNVVSLGIQGTTVHAVDSHKDFTVDLKAAKDAGEKISVEGSSVRFDKGQTSISVTTKGAPQAQDGQITGQVESIALKSSPVEGRFTDAGTVSASFHADLHTMPSHDATVSSVLVKTPAPEVQSAIENELGTKGFQLESVAYTMEVQKNNLEDRTDVGQAVVTMSVSPNWVLNHGGITNTKIARFSDEGIPSILETQFVGLDSSQNMVFSGTSPGGLSIFAMISVKSAGQTAPAQESPVPVSTFEGAGSLVVVPPLLFFAAMIWIRRQ